MTRSHRTPLRGRDGSDARRSASAPARSETSTSRRSCGTQPRRARRHRRRRSVLRYDAERGDGAGAREGARDMTSSRSTRSPATSRPRTSRSIRPSYSSAAVTPRRPAAPRRLRGSAPGARPPAARDVASASRSSSGSTAAPRQYSTASPFAQPRPAWSPATTRTRPRVRCRRPRANGGRAPRRRPGRSVRLLLEEARNRRVAVAPRGSASVA